MAKYTSTKKYKVETPNLPTLTVADAPELPSYTGVKYDDANYKSSADTSFYDTSIQKYKDYAEQLRANQLGEAQKTQQSALKQAYITRLQNENKLKDTLTRSGLRGGITETGMLKLANTYGQARAAANTDYNNSVNSINQSIDQNIFDYTADAEARAEEYRQNLAQTLWQADREDYNNAYQADLDKTWNMWNAQNEVNTANYDAAKDAEIARANAQTEANANAMNVAREDFTNNVGYWTNRYSKSSKSTLRKIMKACDKKIDKLQKGKESAAQKKKIQALRAKREGAAAALANK